MDNPYKKPSNSITRNSKGRVLFYRGVPTRWSFFEAYGEIWSSTARIKHQHQYARDYVHKILARAVRRYRVVDYAKSYAFFEKVKTQVLYLHHFELKPSEDL